MSRSSLLTLYGGDISHSTVTLPHPPNEPYERFDHYMERCLYDPTQGFYASGAGVAGRRGDFITSPEVGPLFGEVLANALDHWWDQLGRPDPYKVIDLGTGPGTLTKVLAKADGRSAAARHVVGIDRATPMVTGTNEIAATGADFDGAVVIANELMDNVPFRIVERSAAEQWNEVYVDSTSGQPVEVMVPLANGPTGLDISPGQRAPLLQRAHDWVSSTLGRGVSVLVTFDYGTASSSELASRGGWLRTYRRHERHDDPYFQPGLWDITTDIAIDQLPPPAEVTTQAEFLNRWGAQEMVAEGRAYWEAHAAAPDLRALKMRSRISEYSALTDPCGLGAWFAATWYGVDSNISPQTWGGDERTR